MTSNDLESTNKDDRAPATKTNMKAVVSSVMAAAIGVQSNKNRESDFAAKSILPFVIVGGIFTVLFIVSLVVVANIAIG